MLHNLYARWMDQWETSLANRDSNRIVRPFEWGLDWLGLETVNGHCFNELAGFARHNSTHSDTFFEYRRPENFTLTGTTLQFPSPLSSPYPENNTVYAEYFPAGRTTRRAVVVIPQWNSDAGGHIGLCKLLNLFGISALRLSLAYHHQRMPAELSRADYHVSSNLGRTIHATQQSVVDVKACLDWLELQGYGRLGLLGTSLGSCVALLAAAHDLRPKAAVFNHVSMNFADVVWEGLSCRHIQASLRGNVSQNELRQCWQVISPATYLDRLKGRDLASLLVWARYDTTFLPPYSKLVLEGFAERNLPHEVVCLPCGHYTSGKFPFHIWDGMAMCEFLHKML